MADANPQALHERLWFDKLQRHTSLSVEVPTRGPRGRLPPSSESSQALPSGTGTTCHWSSWLSRPLWASLRDMKRQSGLQSFSGNHVLPRSRRTTTSCLHGTQLLSARGFGGSNPILLAPNPPISVIRIPLRFQLPNKVPVENQNLFP